jgi:hypothetical protein
VTIEFILAHRLHVTCTAEIVFSERLLFASDWKSSIILGAFNHQDENSATPQSLWKYAGLPVPILLQQSSDSDLSCVSPPSTSLIFAPAGSDSVMTAPPSLGFAPSSSLGASSFGLSALTQTAPQFSDSAPVNPDEEGAEEMDCITCGDTLPLSEFASLWCGHVTCKGCWREWIKKQFEEPGPLRILHCQFHGSDKCPAKITSEFMAFLGMIFFVWMNWSTNHDC